MDTMTAAEAKQKFGQLLEKAQRGPVEITKHGRRVGIFMSDDCENFKDFEVQGNLEERLKRASQDIEAGRIYPADEVFDEIRRNIPKWAAENK